MVKKLTIISVIAVLLVSGYILLSSYAVQSLHSKLKELHEQGISVSQIGATMRYVKAKEILIETPDTKVKLLELDEIRVYPSISSIFNPKKITIHKISLFNPSFFIYRTRDSTFIGPGISTKEKKQSAPKEKSKHTISIDMITIQNGTLFLQIINAKLLPQRLNY